MFLIVKALLTFIIEVCVVTVMKFQFSIYDIRLLIELYCYHSSSGMTSCIVYYNGFSFRRRNHGIWTLQKKLKPLVKRRKKEIYCSRLVNVQRLPRNMRRYCLIRSFLYEKQFYLNHCFWLWYALTNSIFHLRRLFLMVVLMILDCWGLKKMVQFYLISVGLGREAAFSAAVLGDNALMEKAWQKHLQLTQHWQRLHPRLRRFSKQVFRLHCQWVTQEQILLNYWCQHRAYIFFGFV